MMVTISIKKQAIRAIVTIIIALVIGAMITSISFLEYRYDEKTWNNGYCECGGNWRLVDVVHYKNSGNKYYYECEDCFSSICTNRRMC